MKKLSFLIIFLLIAAVGIYVNLWYFLDSRISTEIEKAKQEGVKENVKFEYSSYGFPFSVNYKISNFSSDIYWIFSEMDKLEKISQDPDATEEELDGIMKKSIKKLILSDDLTIVAPLFGDTVSIYLPKEYRVNEKTGEKMFLSKFGGGDGAVIKIYHDVSKLDLLLVSLGLKDLTEADVRESFKGISYEDEGVILKDAAGNLFAKTDKSFLKLIYDESNSKFNFSAAFGFNNLDVGDAYYDWYRGTISQGLEGTEYQQKLVDYLVNFSKGSGPVSANMDLETLGKIEESEVENKPASQSLESLVLKNFSISDKLGETSMSGIITATPAQEKGGEPNFRVNNFDYKIQNFEAVLDRYLALFTNSIDLMLDQDYAQQNGGMMIKAMLPERDDIYRLIPMVRKAVKDVLAQMDAVKGKDLVLNIAQGEKDPMPNINGMPAMQVMMSSQVALAPLMEAIQEIQQKKMQKQMQMQEQLEEQLQ